jgi:hypothetical protein
MSFEKKHLGLSQDALCPADHLLLESLRVDFDHVRHGADPLTTWSTVTTGTMRCLYPYRAASAAVATNVLDTVSGITVNGSSPISEPAPARM